MILVKIKPHFMRFHIKNKNYQNFNYNYLLQQTDLFKSMRASRMSTMSKYGKFFAKEQNHKTHTIQTTQSIVLKENFAHERPLLQCKFNLTAQKLYLVDSAGVLIGLNLLDNTISTLKNQNVVDFAIQANNSFTLLVVNKKSQLLRVHFQSKKILKMLNLNMGKILAFQKNYLREQLLLLDNKLLYLYDLTNSAKNLSLKAVSGQLFSNACFASNNRFLILAVKNIEIRVLELMNLKTLHNIKLPFQVEDLKIEVSFDSKKIAIYGKCPIIFFMSLNEKMELSYQLVQLPQIKYIRQLRYTFSHQIVFLANDQVIYGIAPDSLNRMVPIFNSQELIRLMGFDLSLDAKRMAVVSSRTVTTVSWQEGLRKLINNSPVYKDIQFVSDPLQCPDNVEQNKEEVLESEEEQQDSSEQREFQKLQVQHKGNLIAQIQKLNHSTNVKVQLQQIYDSLQQESKSFFSSDLFMENTRDIIFLVQTIYAFYGGNSQNTFQTCSQILRNVEQERTNICRYSSLIIPEIYAMVEKSFGINFQKFAVGKICGLFSDYFHEKTNINRILKWLIENIDKPSYPCLYFVVILQELLRKMQRKGSQDWKVLLGQGEKLELECQLIFGKVEKLAQTKQFTLFQPDSIDEKAQLEGKSILMNEKIRSGFSELRGEESLEELIAKQQRIRQELSQLRKQK